MSAIPRKVSISLFILSSLLARPVNLDAAVDSHYPSSALSFGALQGNVVDSNDAPVPRVQLTIENLETEFKRSSLTDGYGFYQFAAVPAGSYKLTLRMGGFKTHTSQGVFVEIGRTAVHDFTLAVGELAEIVEVSPNSVLVELSEVGVGQVINQRTVQEIPLNGRNFIDLGLLVTGSVTPPQSGSFASPTRGGGSLAMNTAGNREDTVNFQINGVTLNDQVNNTITFNPPITSIREFKIVNSTFSAEFGRNSGAIANVATRSGTRDFHGELYEYLRNDFFDARNFFNFNSDNPPPFKRHQYGFALGGPVLLPSFGEGHRQVWSGKDRTFFFFNYERIRQRQAVDLNTLVLSEAQRASVTDPVIQRLLPLIPGPNLVDSSGASRFVGSTPANADADVVSIDVSHRFSDSDSLHGFYMFQDGSRTEPTLQGSTLPGFGDIRSGKRYLLAVNETHIFNPDVINSLRFGFNRIDFVAAAVSELNPVDFGINVGVDSPIGIPQINIPGAFNFGGPARLPQGRDDRTFIFSDSVNYLVGKHSLKFGGEYRIFQNSNLILDTGSFNFPNVAAFIAGNGSAFSITLGEFLNDIRQDSFGAFFQDSFRLSRTLTLELGARYDVYGVPKEKDDRFIVFDPATSSLLRVGRDIDQPYRSNYKNIQPRVGIAWDPFGKGKTSVRAAYGIYVEQPTTNIVANSSVNPPLANPLSFTGAIRLNNAINVAAAAGLAPLTIDHGFKNANVQSWNLNVQHEIVDDLGFMIGYVGSKGTNLRYARNLNQPVNGVRPFPRLSLTSPELPNAALGNIVQIESGGNSSYQALWSSLNKRFSKGFQFDASYTWSKSIDYNSLNSPPQIVTFQNSYNVRGDRGLSDYDARHRFVFHTIYELPFKGNRLKDGWQLGAILQMQSGNPVNIVTSNTAVNGIANTVRPDLVGPIQINGTVERWFETSSFSAVPRFGTLGRNVVIGPAFSNLDASITKNTRINDRFRIQSRFEVFDVLNKANFGQPGRVVGSATFARITNTRFPTGDSGSSRQLQFAIKLIF